MLPFEVEVPYLRILAESRLEESEWAQACFDQLNLIEGKRLAAMSHRRLYQRWVKNAFDKKVRPRKFNKGNKRGVNQFGINVGLPSPEEAIISTY